MYRAPVIPVLCCDSCGVKLSLMDDLDIVMYMKQSASARALEKKARSEGWYLDNGLKGKSYCPSCKRGYEEALSDSRYPDFKFPETGNFMNGKGPEVKEYNRNCDLHRTGGT